jgi:hypothetical protein
VSRLLGTVAEALLFEERPLREGLASLAPDSRPSTLPLKEILASPPTAQSPWRMEFKQATSELGLLELFGRGQG